MQNEQHTPISENTQTAQPRKSRGRKWLKALLITFGVLLSLVLVALAAVIIWLGPIAEWAVEKYDMEYAGRRIEMSNLRIQLFKGDISVDSLYLFEANESTHFVSVDRFEGHVEIMDALDKHINIGRLALTRPRAYVVQNGSQFNFDDLIEFISTKYASDEEVEEPTEPWLISIKNVSLEDGVASYLDRELDKQWELSSLNIKSDSIMLSNAMTHIDASMRINREAQLSGHLGLNLESYDMEFKGQLSDFQLGEVYKYIVPVVNLRELYGLLSTELEISGNVMEAMAMNITGDISVDSFHMTAADGRELLSAENISAEISELNLEKQRYVLSSLTADNYSTQFIMQKDGTTNFDGLFYDEPEVSLETKSESVGEQLYDQREMVKISTDDNASVMSGMTLRIGDLHLRRGNIFFADRTMKKDFEYRLNSIDIQSRNFDIARNNKITIKANMQRQGTAMLRWEGSLNDFYNQSLLASLQNVNMEDFTPYTEHYTAFPITSGNLTFRSQNTIHNGELSGMNRLGTYDFKVGKKDKSLDPEFKIPLRLGVYVLTDKDNHIDVDLPITGHIDSPEFSLRKVIFKAIGNLLVKIVASPFSWMSDEKKDTFKSINFELLDPGLNSEQYARLDKMAESLKEDETLSVRLTQRVNYNKARREIAELNLKMAYYNSTQREADKRLDMLDLVLIQEMKLGNKEVSQFADSLLIAKGMDPQHLSTHAKAEALYGDVVDLQLIRLMEARNKTISDYMAFQHKELAPERFSVKSMTGAEMREYNGKERLGVTLIIDGEEMQSNDEEDEKEAKSDDAKAEAENNNSEATNKQEEDNNSADDALQNDNASTAKSETTTEE